MNIYICTYVYFVILPVSEVEGHWVRRRRQSGRNLPPSRIFLMEICGNQPPPRTPHPALALSFQVGVNILGTRPEDIDRAEDRDKFSAMLDSIGVDQVRAYQPLLCTTCVLVPFCLFRLEFPG